MGGGGQPLLGLRASASRSNRSGPANWPPGSPSVPSFETAEMSTEDDPEKLREDDAEATPEWHRAGMAFLKDKFGLTPAQSRLVLRLVAGDTLRFSAAALGIGYETARTTLKSVFRKTGTHRQAELVTMIIHAGLPSPQEHHQARQP